MFKDYNKYLKASLRVYIFVLVIVFIMKLVGLDYFGLDTSNPIIVKMNDFCIRYNLTNLWYCITLYLYGYIIISISANNKKVKLITLLSLPFTIFHKIMFIDKPFISFILDIIILCTATKIAKGNPFNTIKVLFLNFIYQVISLLVRDKSIIIEQKDFIQALIFNLDYILLCVITYKIYFETEKGGIKSWVDGEVTLFLQMKKNFSNLRRNLQENYSKFKKYNKQDKATILIYTMLSLIWNVFSVVVVLFVARLNNTLIECLFILTSFWLSKKLFGKPFHLKSMMGCFVVSNASYYVLNRVTTPIGISMLVPVMLGVGLSYITSKFVKNIKPLFKGMSEEDFNNTILKVVEKDSDKYNICYDFFIKKENAISLGYKYHYTEHGIRKIIYRVNEKIKALN